GHVARDDAAGADDRIVANRDARQDDGSAADPDVVADSHRLPVLQPLAADGRIARMIRRVDLDAWSDLAQRADLDAGHVEQDAVVVEERAAARVDVESIVA